MANIESYTTLQSGFGCVSFFSQQLSIKKNVVESSEAVSRASIINEETKDRKILDFLEVEARPTTIYTTYIRQDHRGKSALNIYF